LTAVAAHLEATGVDVVAADPEVAAGDAGGGALIRRVPRHRRDPALAASHGAGPAGRRRFRRVMDGVAKATRQRIRRAERDGVAVPLGRAPRRGDLTGASGAEPAAALGRFYDLLRATGDRRGFGFAGADEFVTWWVQALAAGHLVYLEAREDSVDGDVLGGLVLYRHGRRLSTRTPRTGRSAATTTRARCTSCAGGRSSLRSRNAGPRWTSAGPTSPAPAGPEPGEPTYGLYEHKRSFGATVGGARGRQERVARAWRYAAGRAAARAVRVLGGDRLVTGHARDASVDEATVAGLLAAAEPAEPRAVAGLVERLRAADLVRGARRDNCPSAPRAWATSRSAASPTTRAPCARARCSWRSRASTSTATTSSRRRRRRARRWRSSSTR
jgi:hypothetical protein